MDHLAPFILTWGPGPPGRAAFCESQEEVITGRLLSTRHIFGLRAVCGDHTGCLDSDWTRTGGAQPSLADKKWALSRGEKWGELCGGRGSDKPGMECWGGDPGTWHGTSASHSHILYISLPTQWKLYSILAALINQWFSGTGTMTHFSRDLKFKPII